MTKRDALVTKRELTLRFDEACSEFLAALAQDSDEALCDWIEAYDEWSAEVPLRTIERVGDA